MVINFKNNYKEEDLGITTSNDTFSNFCSFFKSGIGKLLDGDDKVLDNTGVDGKLFSISNELGNFLYLPYFLMIFV